MMPPKAAIPRHITLIVLLALMPVATALGQERPWSLQGSFGLTATSFAERAAATQGSVGVRLGFAPRLFDVLAAHVEFGVEYLGPICFEAGDACEAARTRSDASETFMLSGAVAAGMLTPPLYLGTRSEGVDVAVGLFAGREWVEAGLGRGECLNCRVSGIDLRAGLFVEPTLELWFFSDIALGASYRRYSAASDLRHRFTVRFIARGID